DQLLYGAFINFQQRTLILDQAIRNDQNFATDTAGSAVTIVKREGIRFSFLYFLNIILVNFLKITVSAERIFGLVLVMYKVEEAAIKRYDGMGNMSFPFLANFEIIRWFKPNESSFVLRRVYSGSCAGGNVSDKVVKRLGDRSSGKQQYRSPLIKR